MALQTIPHGTKPMQPNLTAVRQRPMTLTPAERDRKLVAELHGPLTRILYRAWQLHQLGAADAITWETAPPQVRTFIHTQAIVALASVSALRLAPGTCVRCLGPLLTAPERVSTHCSTCVQEYLVRR